MKREYGFTLLELMVTVVILCILLGLAIPGFSSWLPNYRLRGATRDIYSNLQLAKMTAVKDRARCGVLFDAGNQKYQVISSGSNRTWESTSGSRAGDDVILKEVTFSEYGSGISYGSGTATGGVGGSSLEADSITFADQGILFDSRGIIVSPSGATSTGGYVYVKNNKDKAYAVGVLPSGVIVMRRWSGTAWQQ